MQATTDLAVIGAGPAGYTAAIRGAQKDLNVVLIERETIGGVSLNHGCIPAKALIHAAGFQKDIDHWNALGIETDSVNVDFDAIQDWKDSVIDQLDQQVLDSLDHHGVELLEGTAHFVDSETLQVDSSGGTTDNETQTIDFETAIIATGSNPIEIPGLEYDQPGVITSRDILQVDDVPDEIVVVGGGYIGMEAVTKFSKFGARVKIVEALDRVLTQFEPEIVNSIQETSEMYDNDIYTSTLAQGVEYDDGTPVLVAEQDGEEIRLSGDHIVVAAGRTPTSAYDRLALNTTNVELTDDGFIEVNNQFQTADDSILAIGDAAGPPYLAHISVRDGKTAAAVAAGEERTVDAEYMPTVMYTDPEVATVGLSEAEATEQHDDVLIGRVPMQSSGRALTTDKTSGYLKIIADTDEQLLGVRIVGARASDTIAEATLALKMGASLDDISTTMHAHPTFPETLVEAAEAAQGEAIHVH
ncbi:dihydrolipoyl dehydrogenase [Haloquadratum walsbyi]|jgi:dihydrolipoamide dehydrogenase|uniref:Dihydrolipoyl dehydrogenase n=1 Tax=Haloquadratum walsbyi J07HQW2 TaxID=1238425 RepID=U1PT62_9EURY|nr:dihydrolipoyl dehydrogenase [Haloquadratum walsbyi]ERG96977.1 MAG: dihydrolipoamide dehydrogenase [Haloquadratum walsbyi J07HQW2]